ncbi:prepilin-type N-terminal cleavage/methylation domain-containing protein [Candidatus Babeliales bacterium]|nr:prepilin-type N-terminal cleavage/methylation domain-containing protein [Candidatus Babeliales bacterium]
MMIINAPKKNNKKGFALFEAVISVAILGILLVPILMMQNTVISRVIQNKDFTSRTGKLQNIFYYLPMNPDQERQKNFDKQYDNPDIKIEYTEKELSEGSFFFRFTGMNVQKVKGTWQAWSGKKELEFMQFSFNPEKEEKDA